MCKMDLLEKVYDRMEEEVRDLLKEEEWKPECAKVMYYLVKTMKSICAIGEMEEEEEKEASTMKMPPPSVK